MQTDPIEVMWGEFVAATGCEVDYRSFAFGGDDTPELADRLGEMVLHGAKRATTSLESVAVADGEVPEVGDYWVVLDSDDQPLCIIHTDRVEVVLFGEVSEEYAYVEGEGDRTLETWRADHLAFWYDEGYDVTDETPVICERFSLVWPVPDPGVESSG